MYLYTLKTRTGEEVFLLPGDELIQSGIPEHKRTYVGPIGPNGEDVVNPAKGQPVRFEYLTLIPNWEELVVGARAQEDAYFEVQQRALWVVNEGIINQTLKQNCEHITSYIRTGKAESPQLQAIGLAAGFVGAALAVAAMLG